MSEQVRDERNLAGAIYGTILATSVVAGLSEGGTWTRAPRPRRGHELAGLLARPRLRRRPGPPLQLGHGFSWSRVGAIARHEWPILASGIPPAIVLALGTIGLFERDTAFWLAIGVGIASLVLWGVAYAREQGYHMAVVALAGALNGLLGVVIVALKVLVH